MTWEDTGSSTLRAKDDDGGGRGRRVDDYCTALKNEASHCSAAAAA